MYDIWCVVEIIFFFDWLKYNLYTPIRIQINIAKKKRKENDKQFGLEEFI